MKRYQRNDNPLKYTAFVLVTVLIVSPLLPLVKLLFHENSTYLMLLFDNNIIWAYFKNTIELMWKVALFSTLFGFGSAVLISFYEFPFKRLIRILLSVPLAIPVYVGAYTYTAVFQSVPVLKVVFKNDFFMNGSVFIYALFLYPYIYLITRAYLKKNMTEYMEASHVLGAGPIKTFLKIVLPLSRPPLFASLLFVLFETLSDFAVVEYYGITTVSKVITDSWLGLGQMDTAAKISIMLLIVIVLIISFEKWITRRKRYFVQHRREVHAKTARPYQRILIYGSLGTLITLGTILPFFEMIRFTILNLVDVSFPALWSAGFTSILTTSIAILSILLITGLYAGITHSLKKNAHIFHGIGVMGYAIPSLVLALGVYVLFLNVDLYLTKLSWLNLNQHLFTGTRIALIVALTIKFMSIAYTSFINTLSRTSDSVFESSSILGFNFFGTYKRIHIPLMKSVVAPVVILLFIDLMKELTLTYSLRPFNYKSLSTEVYRYAGNEMIEVASIPALLLVGICLIFIILLERREDRAKN